MVLCVCVFFGGLCWIFIVVHWLSLVVMCGLSTCSLWAQLFLGTYDLSSLNRDQTHVPGIGRWILSHWTAKEVALICFLECEGKGWNYKWSAKMGALLWGFLDTCCEDEQLLLGVKAGKKDITSRLENHKEGTCEMLTPEASSLTIQRQPCQGYIRRWFYLTLILGMESKHKHSYSFFLECTKHGAD